MSIEDFMDISEAELKATNLVLTHNKLKQTVSIVQYLLMGVSLKEVSDHFKVSQSWVSRVNKKYLSGRKTPDLVAI